MSKKQMDKIDIEEKMRIYFTLERKKSNKLSALLNILLKYNILFKIYK